VRKLAGVRAQERFLRIDCLLMRVAHGVNAAVAEDQGAALAEAAETAPAAVAAMAHAILGSSLPAADVLADQTALRRLTKLSGAFAINLMAVAVEIHGLQSNSVC
jgi:predicted phage gp36 major capsid-like protein